MTELAQPHQQQHRRRRAAHHQAGQAKQHRQRGVQVLEVALIHAGLLL